MFKNKKRNAEQFGLSFLDAISCGFGAILLLFVLTSGKKANEHKGQISNAREIIQRLQSSIEGEKEKAEELRSAIEMQSESIANVVNQKETMEERVATREEKLSLLLDNVSNIEDKLRKQMDEAEEIPRAEETPLPMPNPQKRQYLTNFRLEGERLLVLVESSGSMLETTIDGAVRLASSSEEEKKKAEKWKKTTGMVRWFIANISPSSRYQIAFFNNKTRPILPNDRLENWMDPLDTDNTEAVLDALDEVLPSGPANLEQAFQSINAMEVFPDNIILIMDGLPTAANSYAAGEIVDEDARIQMFLAALRVKPQEVPFNVLLLPFEGDPKAGIFYWSLANYSNGTLVVPSRTWPDT